MSDAPTPAEIARRLKSHTGTTPMSNAAEYKISPVIRWVLSRTLNEDMSGGRSMVRSEVIGQFESEYAAEETQRALEQKDSMEEGARQTRSADES